MALRPRRGTWPAIRMRPGGRGPRAGPGRPEDPGDWQAVTQVFRDGPAETWWAADATLGGWGPDDARRLTAVTADPGTLPGKAAGTW